MTAASSTVVLRDVSVKYEGTTVLGPLDLDILPSERWVVLGPNGSGKTSLIRVLSLYRYPTTGTVEVLGETWGATDVRTLRQRIGLASSSLRDQFRADIQGVDIVMTARHAALETWWHDYSDEDRATAVECPDPSRCGSTCYSPISHNVLGRAATGAVSTNSYG